MKRTGIVLRSLAQGERVEVRIRAEDCSTCRRGQGCGSALYGQAGSTLVVNCLGNRFSVESGDRVELAFDEPGGSLWLLPVLGAYALPTLGLLLAIVLAAGLIDHAVAADTLSAAMQDLLLGSAGLAGLCGGIFAWRRLAPRILDRARIGHCLDSGRIVAVATGHEAYAGGTSRLHNMTAQVERQQ